MESLETKVAVLENSMQQMQSVFTRLDLAISKIGDVSNSINQMLVVHDTKLESQDSINKDLYDSLEQHRLETSENNKELHSRITTTTREIMDAIKELKGTVEKEEEKNKIRIDKLERTKYIMVGAGIVLGAIITKILPMLMKFI
jgi:vacuolar-type H+-ATPase subunit I/STV1